MLVKVEMLEGHACEVVLVYKFDPDVTGFVGVWNGFSFWADLPLECDAFPFYQFCNSPPIAAEAMRPDFGAKSAFSTVYINLLQLLL